MLFLVLFQGKYQISEKTFAAQPSYKQIPFCFSSFSISNPVRLELMIHQNENYVHLNTTGINHKQNIC